MLTLVTLKTCLLVNLLFCADQLLSLFAMLMINVSTYMLHAKMLVFMLPLFWSSKKVFFVCFLLSAVLRSSIKYLYYLPV